MSGARDGYAPGGWYRWLRRACQVLALSALVSAPLLGGWQRLDRAELSAWENRGWDLDARLRARLPLGDAPARAYVALKLRGGGAAIDYLGLAVVDPVLGLPALLRGVTFVLVLALAIPLLLALLAGRVFCGWFCPFGTLARALSWLRGKLLGRRVRDLSLPRARPLRWLLLAGCVLAGALGAHGLSVWLLPHVLLQQAAYTAWLLGGAGAALGALCGLVLAGLVFGPTLYCAALCPTGALFGLLGRARRVRVEIAEPTACGAHCSQCTAACWLQLDPASGQAGPHCDGCTRCFDACPRVNLRLRLRARRPVRAASAAKAALLLPLVLALLGAGTVHARSSRPRAERKPEIVLRVERRIGDVVVALSVIDRSGTKLGIDDPRREQGVRVSLLIVRGRRALLAKGPWSAEAKQRQVYRGPATITLRPRAGQSVALVFKRPTSPRSTPRHTIFRASHPTTLAPGDVVEIAPIASWLPSGARFVIPDRGTARAAPRFVSTLLSALLVFGGLLALSLASAGRSER
ncbi:MAG: 4Fe-4S binding protein [Myxococcales bacterium]|nr:4Fe-4S binding protein [Myxococcales bacterium]